MLQLSRLSVTDGTATSRAGAAGAANGKAVVVFRQSIPPQRIAVRSQ